MIRQIGVLGGLFIHETTETGKPSLAMLRRGIQQGSLFRVHAPFDGQNKRKQFQWFCLTSLRLTIDACASLEGVHEQLRSREFYRYSNRHTSRKRSARCVQSFDDSLAMQFAWRIAFRCVLHRYRSQDIRCWKCLVIKFLRFSSQLLAGWSFNIANLVHFCFWFSLTWS
jgi:hypothetical protein